MPDADIQQHLREVIEREAETLHNTLRHYVLRAGLATHQTVESTTSELLNDVVVEAMLYAERFDCQRDPVAWLLGIAANLIKRRRAAASWRDLREPLIRDLYPTTEQHMSDSELFDLVSRWAVTDPAPALEKDEEISRLLGLVSDSDREVLRLGILHGLSGDALAEALHITPGAARVRLHRALRRLRLALEQEKDPDHESAR
jgi:RNA polymerase sigma factor (sigma-70 family)